MSVSARNFICWTMLLFFPLSLEAADAGSPGPPAAVVHAEGGVWVNGAEAADSTAIFPGDTLETKPGFVASLDTAGSSVLLQPESIVKFEGTFVALEHGSVEVGTSTALSVHVNCVRVEPTSAQRTQYDVTDVSGTMLVASRKGEVNIVQAGSLRKMSAANGTQSATVREGQQATRDESMLCGPPASPDAAAHTLNSKWLEMGGGAAGGVVALCLLLCKGSSSSSVSPSQP